MGVNQYMLQQALYIHWRQYNLAVGRNQCNRIEHKTFLQETAAAAAAAAAVLWLGMPAAYLLPGAQNNVLAANDHVVGTLAESTGKMAGGLGLWYRINTDLAQKPKAFASLLHVNSKTSYMVTCWMMAQLLQRIATSAGCTFSSTSHTAPAQTGIKRYTCTGSVYNNKCVSVAPVSLIQWYCLLQVEELSPLEQTQSISSLPLDLQLPGSELGLSGQIWSDKPTQTCLIHRERSRSWEFKIKAGND